MKRGKNNNKKMNITLKPSVVCVFFFLVGLGLMTISCIKNDNDIWNNFGKNVVNGLGTTLIASAIVSLVLEISNMQSLLSRVLSNILNEDFPFRSYSQQNLEEFNKHIIAELCEGEVNVDQLNNSAYPLYEKKERDVVTAVYYDFHNCKYYITPNSEKKLFHVRAELTYRKKNKFAKDNKLLFKIKTFSINEESTEKSQKNDFMVDLFEINGNKEDISCFVTEDIESKKYTKYYDCKIKAEKDLGKSKECTIKLNYEYNVPMYDTMQSYKIVEPCKRLNHEFKIYPDESNGNEWCLRAVAFNMFYCNQKDEDAKYKVDAQTNDIVKVVFDDWVLPGAGYVVTYYPKE